MRKIIKKVWIEYFEAILDGRKKYELRLNDFEAEEGDVLILKEWNHQKNEYTGRELEKKITYVGRFKIDELFWSKEEILEKGIQIFSLN